MKKSVVGYWITIEVEHKKCADEEEIMELAVSKIDLGRGLADGVRINHIEIINE